MAKAKWLIGVVAGGGLGLAFGGCGEWNEFTCQSDAQCVANSPGVCQPSGHCSFPADDCPSGQRYGQHSGALSGQCVDAVPEAAATTDDEGGGSSSSTTAAAEETGEPSLGSSTSSTSDGSTSEPVATSGSSSGGDLSTGEPVEPVDPDLVLWLELERPPADEVLDSSSYGSDGSCMVPACPELASGIVGQGAAFDGVDDVIAVPHVPSLETTEGVTVATWIHVAGPPLGHQALLTKPLGLDNENSWELFFWSESITFGMSSAATYYGVEVPWPYAGSQWVHLAGTWDGATVTLWVDGAAVASIASPAIELDDHPVLVGADEDLGSLVGHFEGTIDDVRVYRRALTAEEIAALASG